MDDQVAEMDWNVSKLLDGVGLWCLIPPLGNDKLIDQVCTVGRTCGAAPTSSRVDLDKLSVAILLVADYSRTSQMPVNDIWMCWGLGSIVALTLL